MSIKNTYQREIERKPLNNILFSGLISVTVILLTIFLGIKPTAVAIRENRDYKKQLDSIKSDMETKLSQIEEGKTNLVKAKENIVILNQKIPTEVNFQNFLEKLVGVTAESQFIIQQVRKQDGLADDTTIIPVQMRVKGNIQNLAELLYNLENEMTRFVSINKVRTQQQREENYDLVEIDMNTYILK